MNDARKLGVVLFQLGGPDSLAAVEPFLYNLFSDPDIIDFPFARLARPTLARMMARHRAGKVRAHYQEIGGRSPIIELTRAQAVALERELRQAVDARVWVAMRYWHPLTKDVVQEVEAADLDEVLLLPLYPQSSKVTTGSSLNEWQRQQARRPGWRTPVKMVKEFYRHPLYLEAVVERINAALSRFPSGAPLVMIFSAHGVQCEVIESGDPYQQQTEATVELVMERGGWPHPHLLCYQSRVGPGRWLEPMLHTTLERVRVTGAKRALVVPISFVTEHVETLHEVDHDARAQAARLGFGQFEMMPALNDSPAFIRALADLVLKNVTVAVPRQAGLHLTARGEFTIN